MSFKKYLVITQVIKKKKKPIIIFQIWNTAEKSKVFSEYHSQIPAPSACLSLEGIMVETFQ